MGINALFFVVTEHHALSLVLLVSHSLSVEVVLLEPEFFDTVAVDLEFVLAELLVSLVAGHNRVEIEHAFVWSLQVAKDVVEVGWLVAAVLSLLGFVTRRKLQLVHDILAHRALGSLLNWLGQELLPVVLGLGMLGEVFGVLVFDDQIQVFEAAEGLLGQQFHLVWPDNGYAHVFARVGYDCASQHVRVNGHKALLIHAEVSEELGVLLKVLGESRVGPLSDRRVIQNVVGIRFQNLLVVEETALRNEELDVVVYSVDQEVPVDGLEDLTLHCNDQVSVILALHHVVEGISSWVFNLKVFG